MKYMLLIFSDASVYADPALGPQVMGEYMAFTQAIVDSGEFVSGEALQGSDTATVVRSRDGQVSTTDGPYVETKEYLGGYYVVDVKDLDRAIEIAAMIPDSRYGGIEVRPVMEIPG
jgi:hypothetical protein